MDNEISEDQRREQEREQQQLEGFVIKISEGPDLRVSKDIIKFCSVSSSDNLKQHYEKRKTVMSDRGLAWIKSLVEKLGNLAPSPALAGLGGLAIAVFIDTVSFSPDDSTMVALRSVFAEEKASEVWDQIDECLKRYTININNKEELVNDLRRIENQLSLALTKLKNSMLGDRQMSFPALKAWVNGAAFHIQILIHLVRLGGILTCDSVKNLLTVYDNDLDPLFEKHRELITSKCRKEVVLGNKGPNLLYVLDEESQRHLIGERCSSFDKYVDRYYDQRYMRQKADIQQHFREVSENLQSLVDQTNSWDRELGPMHTVNLD